MKGQKTPCIWCPKIPAGDPHSPSSAIELTEENFLAYLHYQECKAVGEFPSDPIVRRNAALIRRVEDLADQVRDTQSAKSAIQGLRGL